MKRVCVTVFVALSALLWSPTAFAGTGPDWDKLAQCESSGNWRINTGNGYYGGIQFSRSTWLAFKSPSDPAYAHLASKERQIAVGQKVLRVQGPKAWPSCSKRTGWYR